METARLIVLGMIALVAICTAIRLSVENKRLRREKQACLKKHKEQLEMREWALSQMLCRLDEQFLEQEQKKLEAQIGSDVVWGYNVTTLQFLAGEIKSYLERLKNNKKMIPGYHIEE